MHWSQIIQQARQPAPASAKPRWEFLWWDEADAFRSDRKVFAKYYVARTIEQACDKMLRFINSRPFVIAVDYEAKACHASPRAAYDRRFINLSNLDHEIRHSV